VKRLFSHIISAILGLWIATLFIQGVIIKTYVLSNFFGFPLTMQWQMIVILGIILGILNYFANPFLKTLSLPLGMISVIFLSLVMGAGFLFILDFIFQELLIPFYIPLIYTAIVIWAINIIISKFLIHE
jgi:uncharacterized membrane protein YvlD (DUF360 family)